MKPSSNDTHGPVVIVKPRPRCATAGCPDSGMLRCPVHRDLLCPIHFRDHDNDKCRVAPAPAVEPPKPPRRAPPPPVESANKEVVIVGAGARVRRRMLP